jgi:A/G-specific adenine glycosylase
MNSYSSSSDTTKALLNWYTTHRRALPWRESNDPYRVWISEIILQQTRIEQGIPYYYKILNRFPDVQSMANAPLDELLKLWQGLGYYSRARNMHFAACQIVNEYEGLFPSSYENLIGLKGIGEYTAAAISSISFGEAKAVVDGNVFRFLSRFFGLQTPINTTEGKKQFTQIAQKLIDPIHPGDYNQAIMDFGSIQCTPSGPDCQTCPFSVNCFAYSQGVVQKYPYKLPAKEKQDRYFLYFCITDGISTWIQQRKNRDIWQDLWEFPLVEETSPIQPEKHFINKYLNADSDTKVLIGKPTHVKHVLSHRVIHATFLPIRIDTSSIVSGSLQKIPLTELNKFAIPRLIERYLTNHAPFNLIL